MYLNILILFSVISVIHCCGKQTPPNFGVPVFKPPDSNDDNYTVKKDILIREERSVTGKYRHKNAFYYSLEEDDTPAEYIHDDIKGNENSVSYGKSQSSILNVIRTVPSESRHPELTHNRDTVPSKQKHKTDDVQESEIQFGTSANRIKRDTSERDVRNSLPNGSESEATEDGKQEQEESGGGGGGWNAKAAVPGFVLAAAMLVGITCFIR